MSERTVEGTTTGAVDSLAIKQKEIISMQLQKSICKIKGKLIGTGFFCYINYENKNIPCLMTNYHILDDKYIKDNNKIEIIINDNKINIIINIEDIIYKSKKDEYDLIIIKLKEEYMKNINYLELDDNLFNESSLKEYESIYILHYLNEQNASVSYGKDIIYDPNYKYDIQYKCNIGSSGGPILNLLSNKIIGIHKGCIQKNDGIKYNIGTFLKYPLKEINNNNLYNNYNIELKNPIHILNDHTDSVRCLTVMNDGRLVSGSNDKSIIIYNKETYKPDIIIKEHSGAVKYIIQLSSGILASCSNDGSIKLFNIKENKYEVLQTLNDHTFWVNKIIELKNKTLVSCSDDCSIIFYIKDNIKYKKDYQISTNGYCWNIIQTTICFYDLLERKVKSSISNMSNCNMIMMRKDLLIITGYNKISIINVNNYKLRIINVPGASYIRGVCILNQNMLLTGDESKIIRQWRIEGDNLILISKKEKAHDLVIYGLLNLGNGHIASGSWDKTIKIW